MHYEVDTTLECGKTSGYIKYIGNEPIPQRVKYSIDNSSGDVPLESEGEFTLPSGCSYADIDSVIEVVLEWDDNSEIITLEVK